MKQPHLNLLMADQMRGDCLGIAGHPDVKTPCLDALAAEGTRFPNAWQLKVFQLKLRQHRTMGATGFGGSFNPDRAA